MALNAIARQASSSWNSISFQLVPRCYFSIYRAMHFLDHSKFHSIHAKSIPTVSLGDRNGTSFGAALPLFSHVHGSAILNISARTDSSMRIFDDNASIMVYTLSLSLWEGSGMQLAMSQTNVHLFFVHRHRVPRQR